MKNIAFYISGHGFGHAVRSIELMKALTRLDPFLFFYVKTSAPQWLFRLNACCNYIYSYQENDVGTIQVDFENVDKKATLKAVRSMLRGSRKFVAAEKEFLQKERIRLVLADIPPLAFAAAAAAGCPAVAVTNFSWDWIYGEYVNELPAFEPFIARIRRQYAKAQMLYRLPMHGELTAFRKIVDVPLISRRAQRKPGDVRRMLGLADDGRPLILIALRPSDFRRIDRENLLARSSYRFILFGQEQPVAGFINLPNDIIPFQELVNAVDVVVSKPGYGIVSECFVNQTPLLYTSRNDFLEYHALHATLDECANAAHLPPSDFFTGNWHKAIDALLDTPWDGVPLATNGAEVVARHILHEFADRLQ